MEEFFDCYGKLIYFTAQSVCQSHEDADEVVNDVLVKVWNIAESVVGIDNPEGWIYAITLNAAKDKNKYKKECLPLIESYSFEETEYENILDRDYFYYLLRGLKDAERQIIIYKFEEDMTLTDIAAKIGLPLSNVSYKYYSAIEKIKRKIEKL